MVSCNVRARDAGYRMPAEWEPHERCWMQWPDRSDFIWDDIGNTQAAFAQVARAIRQFEPLIMIVSPDSLHDARTKCGDDIDYLVMKHVRSHRVGKLQGVFYQAVKSWPNLFTSVLSEYPCHYAAARLKWSSSTCATQQVNRLPVSMCRNSFGPCAFDLGPRRPVTRN